MEQEILNGFRLSPQQERLWLLQQDSQVYVAQCLVRLEGNLDKRLLEEAISQIVAQHEILRTKFRRLPGMHIPVQIIGESGAVAWQSIDPGKVNSPLIETKIEALFEEARHAAYDLEHGPLLHATLIPLSSDSPATDSRPASAHLLLLGLPALCADAWSLKNLVQAIGRVYAAGSDGQDEFEERLQYVQFSEWQHELLADEDAEVGKAFWRSQNLSALPVLKLPFETKAEGKAGFMPAFMTTTPSEPVIAQLNALADQHDTSVATLLLACWQTLLWRLTGQPDVVVANAGHGRQHEVLEDGLGLFARWLPIHGYLQPDFRFSEVLAQIDNVRQNAQEWQEYFAWEDNVVAGANGVALPFLPVGFEFEERPSPFQAQEVTFTIYKQVSYSERFNLKLGCVRSGHRLTLEFHYDPNHFQRHDVERLARHFDTLLQSVVADPGARVSELAILSGIDRQQLLMDFNQTRAAYPAEQCLHHLFEAQAARTPNNTAVVYRDQQLTYAQLNAQANQLAHHLQKLSIGPEIAVGLCLERSPMMLVGFLGILKAGGAYLPLDPTYPKERLAYTLADARAPVLLTQQPLISNLQSPMFHRTISNLHVLCLDSDWEIIAQESEENPVSGVNAANLAYVIYTSGSTGRPKGVMVQHRSVINLAEALRQRIYAGQEDRLRLSLNAPLTFDSSVKQLVQLLYGHALHIVPEETRLDGRALLAFAEQQALDVLDCTPAQLRLMLEAGLTQQPGRGPKMALVGGEAIDEATWAALQASTQTAFYNVYGPTECTVDATVARIATAPAEPTIGRPLANTQIYILDAHLQPVPIGVPGELHIGGAGIARGYQNTPAMTASKFIPDPFSDEPGARLYKTGDLAAYLPDGHIKFLGRADHQVKLRGFRIELGEIETVLGRHPAVRNCVASVREEGPGDQRLVAYVVMRPEVVQPPVSQNAGGGVNELRTFLRAKLPEYMIPSAFVTLDELPLTRNGKVDRQALPAPESVRPQLQATYIAPRTQIEERIAAIWQEVLQVEKVGVDDNFFDLGGHSLLMVRVHTKLRQAFAKEISLIDMFRNPTVGLLARYFAEAESEQSTETAVAKGQERAERRLQAKQRRQARAQRRLAS